MYTFHNYQKWSRYYKNPKILAGGAFGLFLLVLLCYFIFRGNSPSIPWNTGILNDRNAPSKTYFEGNTKVTTSSEEANLRDKLKEQGRMQGINFTFNSKGFKKTVGDEAFRTSTMVQMEIDASSTWLPEGTKLTLKIPWAELDSLITIPGRYRYLITFKKWGDQKMTLSGKWLDKEEIVHVFEVR